MSRTEKARPIQLEAIQRRAKDGGLTSEEVNDLCLSVTDCSFDTLSVNDATNVLIWLIAAGPERAKYRIAELRGQQFFL